MATQTGSVSGALPPLAILELVIQPSGEFRALPQQLGKAAEHTFFLQEEWKFPETAPKDKDHPCLTEPLCLPSTVFVVVCFGLSLLFHYQCVPASDQNYTLLKSALEPCPSVWKGSQKRNKGIFMNKTLTYGLARKRHHVQESIKDKKNHKFSNHFNMDFYNIPLL